MKTYLKALGVAAAIAATSLGFVQGAQAQDYWDRRGGNDAAIAVGAGILGLAVGAAIADRSDGRYYDRRFYGSRRYVTVRGRPGYYYYYDGAPRRYYQDRYFGRPNFYGNRGDRWNGGYGRGYYGNGWNRGGWNRGDWNRGRGYGRDGWRDYDRDGWRGRGDYRREYRR